MNPLYVLWNLPALPALVIWGGPIEGFLLWLVWKTRKTVGRTASLTVILPDLTPEEQVALRWSVGRAIKNELELYNRAKGRGEV